MGVRVSCWEESGGVGLWGSSWHGELSEASCFHWSLVSAVLLSSEGRVLVGVWTQVLYFDHNGLLLLQFVAQVFIGSVTHSH